MTLLLLLIQVLYTKYYSEQPSQKGHLSPRGGYFNYQPTANLPTNDVVKKADNWIVVTTINRPTDAIRTLAQLPNWKVVVVADKYVIISDIFDTSIHSHSFPVKIQNKQLVNIFLYRYFDGSLTCTGKHQVIGLFSTASFSQTRDSKNSDIKVVIQISND